MTKNVMLRMQNIFQCWNTCFRPLHPYFVKKFSVKNISIVCSDSTNPSPDPAVYQAPFSAFVSVSTAWLEIPFPSTLGSMCLLPWSPAMQCFQCMSDQYQTKVLSHGEQGDMLSIVQLLTIGYVQYLHKMDAGAVYINVELLWYILTVFLYVAHFNSIHIFYIQITVASCDGKCPSATIFNVNIDSHIRFCKCCRENGVQNLTVPLYCSGNGTEVMYVIQEPLDCSCQWN